MAHTPLILVVAETRDSAATSLTREVLGLARSLEMPVAAVTFDPNDSVSDDLIAHGADRVYRIQPDSDDYEGEVWLPNVERLARDLQAVAVIAGHTPIGADLAPRLAVRLGSAAAMGCVAITADAGRLVFTRACHGGNVRETLELPVAPAVATVKAGVGVARADAARRAEVIDVARQPVTLRLRVVSRTRDEGSARLEDAKVVVAGGRGLEGAEGFRVLEDLAKALDGVVGASRVPCDLGWCPHSWQIGLTGRTVTPDLYIAVGISGAGHHLAGCGNAKTIVAINTDPDAAIFREARFGVVGDYRQIVPALTEAVARLKQA